jgi:hypothetical protein
MAMKLSALLIGRPTALYSQEDNWYSDRVIARAVRRWLPTAAATVRARVRLCQICAKRHWGRFPPSISVSLP